jgi:hypothetical protein
VCYSEEAAKSAQELKEFGAALHGAVHKERKRGNWHVDRDEGGGETVGSGGEAKDGDASREEMPGACVSQSGRLRELVMPALFSKTARSGARVSVYRAGTPLSRSGNPEAMRYALILEGWVCVKVRCPCCVALGSPDAVCMSHSKTLWSMWIVWCLRHRTPPEFVL